jgi:hypothetical protein
MSSERLWILVLVVVSALSGLAGGVLLAPSMQAAEPERGPFADYEALLADTFELDAPRRRYLRAFLERYHHDVEELKSRRTSEIEPELIELGLTCSDRIRKYVLPPERQAEFDRLVAGGTLPDPGSAGVPAR